MIVRILAQGDAGLAVAEIFRKHEISNAHYYLWKSKYAGVSINKLSYFLELESENSRLKKCMQNTYFRKLPSKMSSPENYNTGCKAGGGRSIDYRPSAAKGQGLQDYRPVADGVLLAKTRSAGAGSALY